MKVFISEIAKKGCSGVSFEGCGFFLSASPIVFLEFLQTELFGYLTWQLNTLKKVIMPKCQFIYTAI